MTLPLGAALALIILFFASACETMTPTEGASPPEDLLEEELGEKGRIGGY